MTRERKTFEINDLATLELLNDPLRMRILSLLDEPKAVRTVAEALPAPVTQLYYHFNMMEEAGDLEVAETRKVGAMIQKRYAAAGTDYRPGKELLANIDDPRKFAEVAAATVLDPARLDVEEGLIDLYEQHGPQGPQEGEADRVAIGRSIFNIPKDRVPDYVAKLEAFAAELRSEEDEGESELYSFTYLLFPVAGNL